MFNPENPSHKEESSSIKSEDITTSFEDSKDNKALLQERQEIHNKILTLTEQIKNTTNEIAKEQLEKEKKQFVHRIMEINADFITEGFEAPPLENPVEEATNDMLIKNKSANNLENLVKEEMEAPAPEVEGDTLIEIHEELLLPQDPKVAEELNMDAQGLNEIAKRYTQMIELANEDPIMNELFHTNIDFTWNDFVKPSEQTQGFFNKIKSFFNNSANQRRARLDRINNAYMEMIASGNVGVHGSKAERLANTKNSNQNPKTPSTFTNQKIK